jgi:hypothetical protein
MAHPKCVITRLDLRSEWKTRGVVRDVGRSSSFIQARNMTKTYVDKVSKRYKSL